MPIADHTVLQYDRLTMRKDMTVLQANFESICFVEAARATSRSAATHSLTATRNRLRVVAPSMLTGRQR